MKCTIGADRRMLWWTVGLAALLWFATFYLAFSNFWIKIAASSALLTALALLLQHGKPEFSLKKKDVVLGIFSAACLWALFWAGKTASTMVFPFAEHQIGAIYGKGVGASPLAIFFLLLLITGPCEEIYWRGFLQKNLMARHGNLRGWAAATAIYAGVHIWSMNFMLIGAAGVAGAFWGFLYWKWGRLTPVIISHSLWSAFVFTVVPIP